MKPLIGIVYKTFDTGKTYTRWYHEAATFPLLSPYHFLKERMDFERELIIKKIHSDRIMCIVRGK